MTPNVAYLSVCFLSHINYLYVEMDLGLCGLTKQNLVDPPVGVTLSVSPHCEGSLACTFIRKIMWGGTLAQRAKGF